MGKKMGGIRGRGDNSIQGQVRGICRSFLCTKHRQKLYILAVTLLLSKTRNKKRVTESLDRYTVICCSQVIITDYYYKLNTQIV